MENLRYPVDQLARPNLRPLKRAQQNQDSDHEQHIDPWGALRCWRCLIDNIFFDVSMTLVSHSESPINWPAFPLLNMQIVCFYDSLAFSGRGQRTDPMENRLSELLQHESKLP